MPCTGESGTEHGGDFPKPLPALWPFLPQPPPHHHRGQGAWNERLHSLPWLLVFSFGIGTFFFLTSALAAFLLHLFPLISCGNVVCVCGGGRVALLSVLQGPVLEEGGWRKVWASLPLLCQVGVRGPRFSTSHAHTPPPLPCVVFPNPQWSPKMAASSTVAQLKAWWSLATWQGSRQASEGGQCCV